jgi:folylpolyglutamate synthase/dihydropteroate synthase
VTRASSATSMPVHDLARRLRRAGVHVTVASDPSAALRTATKLTQPGGCVVVTGSLHLVGEVRGLLAADGEAAAARETDAVAGAGMAPSGTSAPPLAG